jgi:hypothetical protein
MVKVLGGDPGKKYIPKTVPSSITALLKSCLLDNFKARQQDIFEIYEEFSNVLTKLYGQRNFSKFEMPKS